MPPSLRNRMAPAPPVVARILEQTWCRLGASRIHGIGVIALRHMPAGFDPFPGTRRTRLDRATLAELRLLPPEVRGYALDFFAASRGVVSIPRYWPGCIEIGNYINHSDEPTLVTHDGYTMRTAREVRAGEELTADYRTYPGVTIEQFPFLGET